MLNAGCFNTYADGYAEFPMPDKVFTLCLGHDLSKIKNFLLTSFRKEPSVSEVPMKETNVVFVVSKQLNPLPSTLVSCD